MSGEQPTGDPDFENGAGRDDVPTHTRMPPRAWVIVGGALFAGLFAGFSLASESIPPAPYPQSQNGSSGGHSPSGTTFPGEGTFLVGTDVPPGLYHSHENTSCAWERTKDASGDPSSVIADDVTAGGAYVDLRAGEFFATSECRTWQLMDRATARGATGAPPARQG